MGGRGLIVAGCLAALLAAGPADARKKRDPCRPKHATTEFSDRDLRVFSIPTRDGDAEFVCVWATRKRFKLAEGSGADATGDEVTGFQLAGRYFLYAVKPIDKYGERGHGEVRLLDTRSGRRRVPALGGAWPAGWALTGAGTIAYTTDPAQGAPRGVYELPLDAPQPQQLDLSDDIDPQSLALAGHTLYWTRGGEPRAAQIP